MKILSFICSLLPDIKSLYEPTKKEIIKYQREKHSPVIRGFIINGIYKTVK